ncbi:helix-turn-helix transcriptional regulator [Bergeyella porcorum]|uniref:helix-turn-helix transcriptional regulator n=1 Tax=Bergeyella porcorum TaxID=1735111 RepID=UPI0035F0FA57
MATNKNAQLRYKILDECFSNPYKKFFIEDLIEICSERISEHYGEEKSVSRRQVLEDMKFMESLDGYEAPIERIKDGRRVYYRYSDEEFSILKKTFNREELNAISEAIEIFSRIQGLEWGETLQIKLKSAVTPNSSNEKVIDFEENRFLKGLKFLNPLYQYIVNKNVLSIDYKPFKEDSQSFIISPYYLKQYNNRWFLLGKNHTENYLQVMALDRMVAVAILDEDFIENTIDFENYFEEIIGITNFETNRIEEVIIELSEHIIPYVDSKPLHSTQRIQGNILTLEVKLNYELESLILSFGEHFKVLSPQSLRNKIVDRLKHSVNQYDVYRKE